MRFQSRTNVRAAAAVALMLGAWLLTGATAGAAELLVFRSDGCAWCKVWDRDVGQAYDKTPEGRRLPIRYVDIDKPRPADLRAVADIRYTPTFVVFDGDLEIGRIVGYPGPDFFWGYLGELIQRLDERKAR